MDKALEILCVIFVAYHQPAKVEQPGEEPLDLPAPHIPAEGTAILCGCASIDFIGSDQLRSVTLHQALIQSVAVIGFVTDESLWHIGHDARFQGRLHQLHFSWRSTFCPQGDRKTMAVCNAHDLGTLPALGFPDAAPPFLAGTNVPSTKHSLRSNPRPP